MGDRYFFADRHTERAVPYAKTVTEHKAPTDDSIRIYGEMKEKAEKSVLDAFKVSNTIFEGAVSVNRLMGEFSMNAFVVHYRCILNGQKFENTLKVESDKYERQAVIEAICRDYAEKIANELTGKFMQIFMEQHHDSFRR